MRGELSAGYLEPESDYFAPPKWHKISIVNWRMLALCSLRYMLPGFYLELPLETSTSSDNLFFSIATVPENTMHPLPAILRNQSYHQVREIQKYLELASD